VVVHTEVTTVSLLLGYAFVVGIFGLVVSAFKPELEKVVIKVGLGVLLVGFVCIIVSALN
jgi:hypothetical protein